MNPTGLPELSKPLRDLNFDQKREKLKLQNVINKLNNLNKSQKCENMRSKIVEHLIFDQKREKLKFQNFEKITKKNRHD